MGYWGDRYLPFSIVTGNKIIANVSVNMLDLILDRNSYRALQIRTVMTHQDYRNQGLSGQVDESRAERVQGLI
jgi:predicted GNAT family acetyltransferase